MEFRVLGVVEALEGGLPLSLGGPKQRSVLAMLLLDPNRAVSTGRLLDGLWGDEPPTRAAATLQVYVSNLRKIIEPDRSPRAEPSVLLTQPPGYLLAVEPAQVDLFRFDELVALARSLWAEGCVAGAAVLLREALALWHDAPLADLADEPFAAFEVPRLEDARIGVTEDRIEADLALGHDVEVIPELEVLVARNPYRERLRRQLMVALYRAGRQTEAIGAYQSARQVLTEELGLEPGRELREMEAAILVHDPALIAVQPEPIRADDVARILHALTGVEPDDVVVTDVVQQGRHSARRAEEELRRVIDRERTARLSVTLDEAGATRRELTRARRAIADGVLDRRRRHGPLRSGSRHVDGTGHAGSSGAVCPYKGLLRFEPEDADWYFGRERVVAELLASVASTRCTGVVGSSGSGKSSLMRAGLLAALRDDALPGSAAWPRLLVTPGADPVLELARALAPVCHASSAHQVRDRLLDDPASLTGFAVRATQNADGGSSVVLVVDQLEEVFTVCRDDALRDRFLDVLVHGASDPDAPTRVLTAIRADYYGRCAEHGAFAELLANATILVGPMRPDELQRAVEEPARSAGLVMEDGLVDQIFEDVGHEPGSLPLLETALLETWSRRRGNTLTLEGYVASGGVRGAVAHLADDVYARMSSSEQRVARDIFLRLAEPGVGTDDVRRRAPLSELVIDEEHSKVLATLIDHRLVVAADANAEVAHEALLREWPRLRVWLEEDRDARRVHRALTNAAGEWAAGDREDDLLFRGTRLAAALDVAGAHPEAINPVERDFLDVSRDTAVREFEEASARARVDERRRRRLRGALVGIIALLVAALVAGGLAFQSRGEADTAGARADAAATRADANRLAALGTSEKRLEVALLAAAEGVELHESAQTRAGLLAAVQRAPRALRITHSTGATSAHLDPEGRTLAVEIAQNASSGTYFGKTVRFYRADDLTPEGTVKSAPATAYLDDGRFATTEYDPRANTFEVVVRDPDHGEQELRLGPTNGFPNSLRVDTNSGTLVVAGLVSDGIHHMFVASWDLNVPSSAPRARLERAWNSLRFPSTMLTPDGSRMFIALDNQIVVLDARSLSEVQSLPGAPDNAGNGYRYGNLAALSPDGTRLASVDAAGQVLVRDVATDAVYSTVPVRTPYATAFAFDPSGPRLAVGRANGRIELWRLHAGSQATIDVELEGQAAGTDAVLFSNDGKDLWSTSGDGTIVKWDAAGDRSLYSRLDHSSPPTVESGAGSDPGAISVGGFRFPLMSRDGTRILYVSNSGIHERDLADGDLDTVVDYDAPGTSTADFSHDGRRLFALGGDGRIRRFDVGTRSPAATSQPLAGFGQMTVGPDDTVFVMLADGIQRFDGTSLEPRGHPIDIGEHGLRVAVDPTGRFAVTGRVVGEEHVALVFVDLRRAEEVGVVEIPSPMGAAGIVYFEFIDGGRRVAVGTNDSGIHVVDRELRKVIASAPFVAPSIIDDVLATGDSLVLAVHEGTVLVLDAATLRERSRLQPVPGADQPSAYPFKPATNALAVRKDGTLVMAITEPTGAVASFDPSTKALRARACELAGPDLRASRWRELLTDRTPIPPCPLTPTRD